MCVHVSSYLEIYYTAHEKMVEVFKVPRQSFQMPLVSNATDSWFGFESAARVCGF